MQAWRFPDPRPHTISTERLLIRPFVATDAEALHQAVDGSRALIWPWLTWAKAGHRTVEESRIIIAAFARAAHKVDCSLHVWGIFDRHSEQLLGGTGLNAVDPKSRSAGVGYWLRREAQGRGIATEAARVVIDHAFKPQASGGWGLRRMELRCARQNLPSVRIAQRLGLRLEQDGVENDYQDGLGIYDELIFAVLRREWDAQLPSRAGRP